MKHICVRVIRAFLCDWEGCMSEGKGLPYDIAALWATGQINSLIRIAKSFPYAFCTGRQIPFIELARQLIGICYSPRIPDIVENGAILNFGVSGNANVYKINPIVKKGDLRKILSFKKRLEVFLERYKLGSLEPGKEVCISANPREGLGTAQLCECIWDLLHCGINQKVLPLVEATYSFSAVDITPIGINKGTGADWWSEVTEIPLINVAAIGDSKGDLSVLEKVGFPACPANAHEEVKKLVAYRNGYIATKEFTEGVFEILGHFLPLVG